MISFLIPNYNYVCVDLVRDLARQGEQLRAEQPVAFDFEVVVADDASPRRETVEANRAINALPRCRYVERTQNVGRAHLCNWLIEEAKFDCIVIIDSDAAVCTPDFVRRYWEESDTADVVCGTLRNPEGGEPRGCELRYRYEQHGMKHRRAALSNEANAYWQLSTFNLLLHRSALGTLRFDERCREYGYEDALLGLELERRGISLRHLDNPLVHTGIDRNASFLQKTETALRTLSLLEGPMQERAQVARTERRLRALRLDGVACALFRLASGLLRRHLCGHHPSLLLFNLYKLGFYTTLMRRAGAGVHL